MCVWLDVFAGVVVAVCHADCEVTCRGLGRQASLMWFNIIGFWAVGFSTGYTLAFRVGWGLPGVWYGILSGVVTTGVCCMSSSMVSLSWGQPAHTGA